MRAGVLILGLWLAGPAAAQPAPDCPFLAPGCERLPRLLEDLQRDLAPMLRDLERDLGPMMEGLGQRLEPYLRELGEMMGDLSGWEAPELLPNGDILIRRRPRPPEDQPSPPVTKPFAL